MIIITNKVFIFSLLFQGGYLDISTFLCHLGAILVGGSRLVIATFTYVRKPYQRPIEGLGGPFCMCDFSFKGR